MHEVLAYHCDYCSKVYNTKKQTKQHEKKCYYNPETKSCASCDFIEMVGTPAICFAGIPLKGGLKTHCHKHSIDSGINNPSEI